MPNESTNQSADRANVSGLDASNAIMTSTVECFALQHSTLNIPYSDGKNIQSKDFLQDVHNDFVYVPLNSERAYVKCMPGKLQGAARDSTYGETFNTVNELTRHFKARFAAGKTYPYYQQEIATIRMKRDETVSDFHDQLKILLSGLA